MVGKMTTCDTAGLCLTSTFQPVEIFYENYLSRNNFRGQDFLQRGYTTNIITSTGTRFALVCVENDKLNRMSAGRVRGTKVNTNENEA